MNSNTTVAERTTASAKNKSPFRHYFVEQLKDIYWAEKHLAPCMKKMIAACNCKELQAALEKHLDEGNQHIAKVEELFTILGCKAEAKQCEAMAGLIEEAKAAIEDTTADTFVRDAALIMAAQKVEHYEIATYGTLRVLAAYLPEKEQVQSICAAILEEEKATDQQLTKVAEQYVNKRASQEQA